MMLRGDITTSSLRKMIGRRCLPPPQTMRVFLPRTTSIERIGLTATAQRCLVSRSGRVAASAQPLPSERYHRQEPSSEMLRKQQEQQQARRNQQLDLAKLTTTPTTKSSFRLPPTPLPLQQLASPTLALSLEQPQEQQPQAAALTNEQEEISEYAQDDTEASRQMEAISSDDISLLKLSEQLAKANVAVAADAEPALFVSPRRLTYTDGATIPITSQLHLVTPSEDMPRGIWPVFRMMDENGQFRDPSQDHVEHPEPTLRPQWTEASSVPSDDVSDPHSLDRLRSWLSKTYPEHKEEFEKSGLLRHAQYPYADVNHTNTLLRAYNQIIRLREMDNILLNAQRQGRISFYMTCRGEEAIHMGSASALQWQDPVFAQYREQGLLMWRGFTLEQFTNQCFSNQLDLGKGRQMPVHYGSRALNYHTVSSPLGTQLPQAVGAAYRLKLEGKQAVAACFFGEGCASTTDFHSALNFAAVLRTPVLFICRNNGYAISTSTKDQYAGDGIVARAVGYGMTAIRVDGNDLFAVHAAVREARQYALEHSAPVLIECMTYRQGHHSTSDDSSRYRSPAEVQSFATEHDPCLRLDAFFQQSLGWMTPADVTNMHATEKKAVLTAMNAAEARPPPPVSDLFTDVYHDVPQHLQEQWTSLQAHMKQYPKRYSPSSKH